MEQRLSGTLDLTGEGAGLHLVALLADGRDDVSVAAAAAERGVTVAPLSRFHLGEGAQSGLVLGFAAFERKEIENAVEELRRALESL